MADKGKKPIEESSTHQRSEQFESKFSFSILSFALNCNLMIHLLLFLALIFSQRRSLELKKFPSTSSLIPLLMKKTPRRNKRPTTNCAVASDI
jgi:hypothetical protein